MSGAGRPQEGKRDRQMDSPCLAGGDEHTKGNTCYRIGNMIPEKPIHLEPLSGERTAEKFTMHIDNFAFLFTMFRQEPWKLSTSAPVRLRSVSRAPCLRRPQALPPPTRSRTRPLARSALTARTPAPAAPSGSLALLLFLLACAAGGGGGGGMEKLVLILPSLSLSSLPLLPSSVTAAK